MTKFMTAIAVAAISVVAGLTAPSAQAQVAEVPRPNAKGDFTTAKVMGNRGYYQSTKWLVVDYKPALNCRTTPNGSVRAVLMPGSVITAVFSGKEDAVVFHQGNPWLKVNAKFPLMSGTPGVCYVRSNLQYVAPISEDFVSNGVVRVP